MWHDVINKGYLAKMGGPATQVYVALLSYSDFDFKEVWPSYSRLAKDTGMSRRSVIRAMKTLESVDLISKVIRKSMKKGNETNFFQFLTPGDTLDTRGGVTSVTRASDTSVPGECQPCHPNNNHLTKTNTTTDDNTVIIETSTKVTYTLSNNSVAALKSIGINNIDQDHIISAFGRLDENIITAIAAVAKKDAKKNPAGLAIRLAENCTDDYRPPSIDKALKEMVQGQWENDCKDFFNNIRDNMKKVRLKAAPEHWAVVIDTMDVDSPQISMRVPNMSLDYRSSTTMTINTIKEFNAIFEVVPEGAKTAA